MTILDRLPDRLRDLWDKRPEVVIALGLSPIVFVVTLVILFAVAGGSDDNGQQESAAQTAQTEPQAQQQSDGAAAPEATVVVVTSGDDQQRAQPADHPDQQQPQSPPPAAQQQQQAAPPAQSAQPADQQQQTAPEAQAQQQAGPRLVAGMTVQPLSAALTQDFDEADLQHGSDGAEGGILPLDNGVVISSGPAHQTRWELLVPSARLKSAIVKVGRTPTGGMGSPDNPYVVGWLDSTAQPGENGNMLLAGHRDYEDSSGNVGTGVCWELVNTVKGDQMLIHDTEANIYYIYNVIEAVKVNPFDKAAGRYLRNTEAPVITLITCEGSFNQDTHQYSHRRVVVGELAAVAAPDA